MQLGALCFSSLEYICLNMSLVIVVHTNRIGFFIVTIVECVLQFVYGEGLGLLGCSWNYWLWVLHISTSTFAGLRPLVSSP